MVFLGWVGVKKVGGLILVVIFPNDDDYDDDFYTNIKTKQRRGLLRKVVFGKKPVAGFEVRVQKPRFLGYFFVLGGMAKSMP